ncbi:FkbM family methyltransferase [Candidatus Pelagibacter sp.]|nr:FkbM family methyltransferase [Candidatus Pelagibacter sp.]
MKMSLKEMLKKIKWLRYIVRRTRKVFTSTPLYMKSAYFSLDAPYANLESIEKDDVIVVGSFKSKQYLLKSAPKRLIENSAHFHGVWEPHIAEFIHSILSKDCDGCVMVDIGANIGATTIPQAVSFPNVTFVCFEAHPSIYQRLKENISINSLHNVQPLNKAVTLSNSGEYVEFYAQDMASENLGLSSLSLNIDIGAHQKIAVEAIGVDAFFSYDESKIALIKIDTQGGELEILRSATKTIVQHRPIIIFEFEEQYHSNPGQQREALYSFFKEIGYELYTTPNSTGVMYTVTFKGFFHGDVVAIPKMEE